MHSRCLNIGTSVYCTGINTTWTHKLATTTSLVNKPRVLPCLTGWYTMLYPFWNLCITIWHAPSWPPGALHLRVYVPSRQVLSGSSSPADSSTYMWHCVRKMLCWSFAADQDEVNTYNYLTCPCVPGSTNRNPSFVGQNYFCESGITRWNGTNGIFWRNGDPLWDGQGCGPTTNCCTFNSPPWFNVQLSLPTTNDIEVRICGDQPITNEDTPIQLIELYVKWTGHIYM